MNNLTLGSAYPSGGIVPGSQAPRTPDLPGEHRIPCPADPALNVESGSHAGPQSPGPGQEASPTRQEKGIGDFQVQLLSTMLALVQEMRQQTAAANRLAQSNEMLVRAMAEGEDMDDIAPATYLDGRPIR
jgi:hypothetical protein